ncbi:hypothetical protein JCM11641_008252 [Rhodosporidiobolus odoratus]
MPCLLAAPPEHTNYHYANILDDLLRYGTLREVIDELNSPRWFLPLGWSQAKQVRGTIPLSALDSSTSTSANLLSAASTAPERHFAFRFACFCILLGRGANPLSVGNNGRTASEVLAVRLKQDKDADRLRFVEELEEAVKYWKTETGYQLPLDIIEWIEVEKEEPDFALHQQYGVAGFQCHEGDFTMSPELENAEEGGHDQSSNDQKRLKLEDGELPGYVDQAPTPRPEPKAISPAAFRQVPAPPAAAPIAKAPSYSKRRVPPPPPPLQSATPTAQSRLPLSVHAPMRPATARLPLEPQAPIPPQPLPPTSITPNGFALAPAVAPLPTSLLQTQAASLTAKSRLPPKPKETLPPAAPPAAEQTSDSRRRSTSTTPVPPRPGPSASRASQTPSSAVAAPPLAGLPRAVVLEDPVTQARHNPTVRQELEEDDVDTETDDGENMELCRPSASPSPPPAASTLAFGPAPAPSPSFAPTSTGAAESKAVSMEIDSSIDAPAPGPTISPLSQLTANPAPSNIPTSAPIISTASSSAPPATTARPTSSSASQPPPKKKSRLCNLLNIQAAKAARHASAQASSPSELPRGSGSGAAQAQERASVSQSPGPVAGQTVQGGTAVAGSVDEAESSQARGRGQLERQDERMKVDPETEGEARRERGRTQRSSSTVSSSSTGGGASSGSRPSSRLPPNLPQPKSTSRLPPNLKLAAIPAYPNQPSLGTALSTPAYVEQSLPPIARADGRAPGLVNKDATSIALASGRTPSLPPKPSSSTASLPPTKPKTPTGLRINTTGSIPAKPQTHHSLRDSAVPRFPHNPITAAVHASSTFSPGSTPSTVPPSGPSPRMTSSNAVPLAARPTSTSTADRPRSIASSSYFVFWLFLPVDSTPAGDAVVRRRRMDIATLANIPATTIHTASLAVSSSSATPTSTSFAISAIKASDGQAGEGPLPLALTVFAYTCAFLVAAVFIASCSMCAYRIHQSNVYAKEHPWKAVDLAAVGKESKRREKEEKKRRKLEAVEKREAMIEEADEGSSEEDSEEEELLRPPPGRFRREKEREKDDLDEEECCHFASVIASPHSASNAQLATDSCPTSGRRKHGNVIRIELRA